jgi:hypothetical protein
LALTAVPAVVALDAHEARASVSIPVTYDALLHGSSSAAVVTPIEQRSVWENGRIYTYSRVHVDRAIAGELATDGEAWVRTMGGVVGKIGQVVEGEAVLTVGRPCVLFVHAGPVGAVEVTARAQGQFAIVLDEKKTQRVARSSAVGALIAPKTVSPAPALLAAEILHGRVIDDVAHEVAGAWERTHAH